MEPCRYCGTIVEEAEFCSSCCRPLASEPARMVGSTVGSYRLERLLGEGPIGASFQAAQLSGGGRVRLKLIDSKLLESQPELWQQATSLLRHSAVTPPSSPELVEVSGAPEGPTFVAHRWIEGPSLRQVLRTAAPPTSEVLRMLDALLAALEELHRQGIPHRGLKPENLLFPPQGKPALVVPLDLGLSVISEKTRTGAQYRSPEQARGQEELGTPSDVYSCGIVLHEMLTGRRPFDTNDYDVLMSQISCRRPAPVSQFAPALPRPVQDLVDRALELDPNDRFGSAEAMREALNQARSVRRPPASLAGAARPHPAGSPESEHWSVPVLEPSPSQQSGDLDQEKSSESAQPNAGNKEKTKKIIAIACAAVCGVVGAVLLYLTTTIGAQEEQPAPASSVEATQQPPAESVPTGSATISLSGLPPQARWWVDGHRLKANPFRAPRTTVLHSIRVEAPGYRSFETELTFQEDRVVEVEMEPDAPETKATKSTSSPPQGFKAYTWGQGANARPNKNPQKRTRQPRSAFQDGNAPTSLRER